VRSINCQFLTVVLLKILPEFKTSNVTADNYPILRRDLNQTFPINCFCLS